MQPGSLVGDIIVNTATLASVGLNLGLRSQLMLYVGDPPYLLRQSYEDCRRRLCELLKKDEEGQREYADIIRATKIECRWLRRKLATLPLTAY